MSINSICRIKCFYACFHIFHIELLWFNFLTASETRKMQRQAREHVQRVLDEHEKLSLELENKKRKLDMWSKELNKREALTERERNKLDEEKSKVIFWL